MPLKGDKPIDMSVDRGRVLPLGGGTPREYSGFKGETGLGAKTVDTPNAYNRFSRRTRGTPSRTNDSQLTPRHGMFSALGEIEYKGGTRQLQGSTDTESEAARRNKSSKKMTGHEEKVIAHRTWAEDHPRKLVKKVEPPVRPALDTKGRSPFITYNGMVGKFDVSPTKAQKNAPTTKTDLDTASQMRRSSQDQSGRLTPRYASPFRAASQHPEQSPMNPSSMPLHPEISQGGLAKQQRFAPSRRNTPSLEGVFTAASPKAPPPYKLVPPFFTTAS